MAAAALASGALLAQDAVTVNVDLSKPLGPMKPICSDFGYDEQNYTYTANGTKLVRELGALHKPVYIRAHSLLSTGDGTPALKWGSTNAYTEDSNGNPVYNWTIVDRIFDTYLASGAKPFVEIGFMPKALSTQPDPYRHDWPKTKISAGWSFPPKDYAKWGELVYQWVRHEVARHGESEVNSWYWEVWNEPDIEYWRGTPDEYNKLYDIAARAVKRAAPQARVGGPATTGPASKRAAEYLRQFLEFCDRTDAPLDFVTYHAKGSPTNVEGHVRMGLGKNLRDVSEGMSILTSFPKFAGLPIVLSEADPEGCAACSVSMGYKQNGYRNGTMYPTYTAALMKGILDLAAERKANIAGMLTWAFEFEGQPWFDGFRTLATNGIDKPVMNVFRMASKLGGDQVGVTSSSTAAVDQIMAAGIRDKPDIDGIATRGGRSATLLLWNYHDDDLPGPDTPVRIGVSGLPKGATLRVAKHYRIDENHSNAYTVWQQLGKPQHPEPGLIRAMDRASGLGELTGELGLNFALPRQSVSLLELRW